MRAEVVQKNLVLISDTRRPVFFVKLNCWQENFSGCLKEWFCLVAAPLYSDISHMQFVIQAIYHVHVIGVTLWTLTYRSKAQHSRSTKLMWIKFNVNVTLVNKSLLANMLNTFSIWMTKFVCSASAEPANTTTLSNHKCCAQRETMLRFLLLAIRYLVFSLLTLLLLC